MSLAEGVSARIAYKAHSTGVITAGTEPTLASDPGASGAQILRRVSSSLALSKETYQSAEIRSDRQISDYRHGVRRVQGNIAGELSPLTYGDFFQAASRGTWEAAVSKTESDFTSVEADNTASTFTFAGGNPVTEGFRVGHILRFTSLTETANNSKNFVITGFGGSSNRTVSVYPAPTTMSTDSAFNVASIGKRLAVPSSSFVSRKFAVEIYNEDISVARLFTECRVGGFNVQLPPTGMSTVDFSMMGRNMTMYEGTDSPFFTSPTDPTSTQLLTAVNGLLRVGGSTIAVVTGLNIQMELNPSADPVVGSNLVPEIFLGRANVSGQMTAMFQDGDLINDFINETELELLAYLEGSNDDAAQAMTFYLPRIKLGGADPATDGEGGQSITIPFMALKSTATEASTGIAATTIQICDSQQT